MYYTVKYSRAAYKLVSVDSSVYSLRAGDESAGAILPLEWFLLLVLFKFSIVLYIGYVNKTVHFKYLKKKKKKKTRNRKKTM